MSFSSPLLDRLVALTRDLILVPSTDSRPAERARCFAVLRDHLDVVPGAVIRNFECHGYGSMVVTPRGMENPDILMLGHLDVIEHPDPAVYCSRISDGRIHGPGSGDMKGQLAIMVELFCTLQRRFPGLSFGIAFTSDEEIGGQNGARHLFEDIGLRCGVAIVPDGGSINDITVAEKGILQVRLQCEGRESHAARPWLVPNPLLQLIEAVARIAQDFAPLKPGPDPAGEHWYPTCVPTVFRTANETINCIPGEAQACLDVRFPPPFTGAALLERIRGSAGPAVTVEPIRMAESSEFVTDPLYLQVTEQLTGEPMRLVKASGGSDARYLAPLGIPALLTRPLVGNLHSPDEWIDVESMGRYFHICEEYIIRKLGLA